MPADMPDKRAQPYRLEQAETRPGPLRLDQGVDERVAAIAARLGYNHASLATVE